MWYVNMADKFLSGWGQAPGKAYYCVKCDTLEQAEAVEKAAHDRPEMERVSLSRNPRRGGPNDHVRIVSASELDGPWLSYMRWALRVGPE